MPERTILVAEDLRAARRQAADAFRHRLQLQDCFVVRLISSPGSGKTTLLQETARRLSANYSLGILVGDVETARDAARLAPFAPTAQITTGGACHLELDLIQSKLPLLGRERFDFLFLEDIGNLICPASHDLGEHLRVLVLSTTEGDDKPGKYPKAFRTSQAVVISKLDLLPHVPFSVTAAVEDARRVQSELKFFPLSALSGEGLSEWCDFLCARRSELLADVESSLTS